MTEIGASNFFFVWKNQDNELELVTAPIDGLVLPGILRDSVLVRKGERKERKKLIIIWYNI